MSPEMKKHYVVIGTSGSHDFLRNDKRRFWPREIAVEAEPLCCDGLHDGRVPLPYCCSRCLSFGQ